MVTVSVLPLCGRSTDDLVLLVRSSCIAKAQTATAISWCFRKAFLKKKHRKILFGSDTLYRNRLIAIRSAARLRHDQSPDEPLVVVKMAGAGWWPTVPHCGRGRALASCQDSCCPQTALITHHRALNHPCRLHPSPLPANAKAHKAFVFLCPVAFRFPNGPCIYGRVFIAAVWRPSMAKEKPAICLHVFFGVTLFFLLQYMATQLPQSAQYIQFVQLGSKETIWTVYLVWADLWGTRLATG